jgi:hypothetical protein
MSPPLKPIRGKGCPDANKKFPDLDGVARVGDETPAPCWRCEYGRFDSGDGGVRDLDGCALELVPGISCTESEEIKGGLP